MALTLVLFKSNGRRQDIPLAIQEAVIGRQPDCDIRIPRVEVSRNHCKIMQRDQETRVQDLGSSNGTYLNSERIMEAVIKAGDRLQVGRTVFTVQIDGQPDDIQPHRRPMDETRTEADPAADTLENASDNSPEPSHANGGNDPLAEDGSFADLAALLEEDLDQEEKP